MLKATNKLAKNVITTIFAILFASLIYELTERIVGRYLIEKDVQTNKVTPVF